MITRRRILAAKAEVTPGTAVSPAAADATMHVYDMKISSDVPYIERPQQGSASFAPGVLGSKAVRFTFRMMLAGLGSSGDPVLASVLVNACGTTNSTSIYKPSSTATNCITLS